MTAQLILVASCGFVAGVIAALTWALCRASAVRERGYEIDLSRAAARGDLDRLPGRHS